MVLSLISRMLWECKTKLYWIKNYFQGIKLNYSLEEARKILQEYHPILATSCYIENAIENKGRYNCSVIIPTYNNSCFLKRCIESVLIQKTKYSYQIIIIDDGSTDDTRKILDDFRNIDNVEIIYQSNKGFSGARNAGLNIAEGEYLMFVDSDDRLCQGAIEQLLKKAFEKNADVVAGNYRTISIKGKKIKDYIQFVDEKVNSKNYLSGYSWGKVFNNNLFSNLRFPEGYWYEDSINAQIVWPLAKKIYTISDIVYEYTRNPIGISKTSRGKVKAVDSLYITELLIKDKSFFGLSLDSQALEYFLNMVKLTYKRTSGCNIKVAKSIFVVQCYLIQKFKNTASNNRNNYELELALRNKNYRSYLKMVIKK